MRKIRMILLLIALLAVISACKPSEDTTRYFTVTFDTGEGGTPIESLEIRNGGKVDKPADPQRDGFHFTGVWMADTFEWNFDVDIVTSDLTLSAMWMELTATPSNIQMDSNPFTSVVTWTQMEADLYDFTVSIKPVNGSNFTIIEGEIEINTSSVMDTVVFTPDSIPTGGYYIVRIDLDNESYMSEELLFGGAGTQSNPYLVSKVADVITILENPSYLDQHFLQVSDVLTTLSNPLEINNQRRVEFSGVYDGQNYSLSFTGNGGLFHQIAEAGVVKNLVIDSTTQVYAAQENNYPIGVIANSNQGLIENIRSRALIEDSHLQGGLEVFNGTVDTSDHSTGAGGIVGINRAEGIIREVTISGAGSVKAGRGIGGVSAYNFGLIEEAIVTATLPAGNQANSGNSSNTYSYGGGIAGFNFGTITKSTVSGRVFAQSAYSAAGTGNEGKNVAFGGIAGYNEGTISESSFARTLSAKEFIDKSRSSELQDAANNLGVASIHGDLYVGGIAGINAGLITDTYVGGALIAARDFVGGVAGLTLGSGNITNTYVFAEVAIKDNGGVKLTTPNAKTTLTTYEIAPSGYDANTVLYKRLLNSVTDNVWNPGDLESPKLPEFNAADLEKVGDKFTASGVLSWQQGSVTGVNIALESLVLAFGSTATLEYTISPSSAPDVFTTWTSSDPLIVEVIGEGIIKGVGAGTATVTVTTRDGGYTDKIEVTVEDYIRIDTVTVTSPEFDLPQANTATDRPDIEIGTLITFAIELTPENAAYQNYTLTSSNSRAVVEGNQVTFVAGSGPGNVSITVHFEDASVASLEYRFRTVVPETEGTPISEVLVTTDSITLPNVNDSTDRKDIEVGTVFILDIEILPGNASNKNYTVVSSQTGRATVNDSTVTVIGTGNFSIRLQFEDASVGNAGVLEYRFAGVAATTETTASVTSPEVTLGAANIVADKVMIAVGTTLTFNVTFDPTNPVNTNYAISTSNGRAIVNENGTVTFNLSSGAGNVSITFTFEDPTIAAVTYYFTTTIEE